jgi:hypothetical protein
MRPAVFEIIIYVVIVLIVVTQIILPVVKNDRLFPTLSKRTVNEIRSYFKSLFT